MTSLGSQQASRRIGKAARRAEGGCTTGLGAARPAQTADKCGLTRSPGHRASDELCWAREWVDGKLTFIICKTPLIAGWCENEMTLIHIRNLGPFQ